MKANDFLFHFDPKRDFCATAGIHVTATRKSVTGKEPDSLGLSNSAFSRPPITSVQSVNSAAVGKAIQMSLDKKRRCPSEKSPLSIAIASSPRIKDGCY